MSIPKTFGAAVFLVLYGALVYGFVSINNRLRVTDSGPTFTKGLSIILGMNSTVVAVVFLAFTFLPGVNERSIVKYMIPLTFFISLTAIAIASMKQTRI